MRSRPGTTRSLGVRSVPAAGSEAFVRRVTDSLPLRIAYVDKSLRYRFVNEAQCLRFGRPREEVIGRTREDLLGRATPGPISDRIRSVLEGQAQRFEYEEPAADGTRHIEVQLVPDRSPDGEYRGYFYTGLDVTERSRAEQALRDLTREAQRQSDVLRLVTEALPETVVVVGADGRYRFANRAFEEYCGLPREEIIGRNAAEVLGEAEVARRWPYMARAMAGEAVTFTLDQTGPTGKTWIEFNCIPLRLNGGAIDGFVGISQDVTRQVRERDRLTELSLRDPLTGLLNRAGFDQALIEKAGPNSNDAIGLLYIDLDRFKAVNDTYGHPVGDRLLRKVGERLTALVRQTDSVARLGGDEFAILLPGVDSRASAASVAGKVVRAIGAPFDIDGRHLLIGASVGVAFEAVPPGDPVELIERADSNLYRAKQAGRGREVA
jgi:diguanylate cyclase (GGDEF)-like protein/PAS domain S-box-containing protein